MKIIGIAGGGQLGRMLTDAAHVLGHKVIILDATSNSPAGQVADEQILGDYKDAPEMLKLADKSELLTYEIESVNAEALEEISKLKVVQPVPRTLARIRDKLRQKAFLVQRDIPIAQFVEVQDENSAKAAGSILGYPYILKARTGGFDGRGNVRINTESDIAAALKKLGNALYAEKMIEFEKEIAVVAARTTEGEVQIFPLVETIHVDHICHMTLAPAPVSEKISKKAHDLANRVLNSFEGAGVFGIEMFLSGEEILVNEIAPRVHNSGHWTMEGAQTSQFEQHIRAIAGMPLGPVSMKVGAAVMINILGERNGTVDPQGITEAEKIKGVKVHIYGKMETRIKRKMGHLTAVADSLDEARSNAEMARKLISI